MSNNDAIFYNSIDDLNKKLRKLILMTNKGSKLQEKVEKLIIKNLALLKVANYIICKTFNIKQKFEW